MENTSIEQEEQFTNLAILITPELDILLQILNYLTCIVIIFGNILTITSIIRFQWLRSNTNILICSLSGADLYVGIATFVYHLIPKVIVEMSDKVSMLMYTVLAVGYMSSILHLVAIAMDRLVGVNYPLRYHSIITPRKIKTIIIFAWGFSCGFAICSIGVLFTIGWHTYLYISMASISFYLMAGLVIGIVYLTILPSVYKQAKALSQQTSSEAKKIKREIKASVTVGIILLAYIICWTPNFIIVLLMWFWMVNAPLYICAVFSLLLSTANSAVNCFIYAWKSKEYRRAYITILTCGKRGHRVHDSSTNTT